MSNTSTPTIPPEADYLRDQAWLDGQREALHEERAKYTSSADRLAAEAAALMADREPGDVQFDEESGEGDTIAVERDRDLALSAAARQAVSDIDAALARLDNNTYGICIATGEAIPKERLEAIPEAAVTVHAKTAMF
ncbi:MAG: TraR/DksA C4-type zinc finger protein [Actinomycetota bacterium]